MSTWIERTLEYEHEHEHDHVNDMKRGGEEMTSVEEGVGEG